MATNLHQISNTAHFQALLSEDLNRVSLIYFWTTWAAPCEKMTKLVIELSRKYSAVLFLQVEAETQEDIAESFEIEAVPFCILLRGHTLLKRISGVDGDALTEALNKHTLTPSYRPLSHTDQKPAEGPVVAPSAPETVAGGSPEELERRLRSLMNQSKVVLFMKGSPETPRCGFSRKIVGLLQGEKVEFSHFDILSDESVRQGLKKLNDWPTFPQLIINGELVGGLDIVQEMIDNRELHDILA